MKILLIKPPYKTHVMTPPIGLGYIASSLEKEKHCVTILDVTLHRVSPENVCQNVIESNYDAVGISMMSPSHFWVKELVGLIKKKKKDVLTLLGGPHVSALPEFVLKDIQADVAVVGEGENSVVEVVEAYNNKKTFQNIKGIFSNENGRIKCYGKRELIGDLDTLVFPSWHLMTPSSYKSTPVLSTAQAWPIAPIFTSRGCPYLCTFCATNVTWENKWRRRSPQNVVDEIEMLIDKYGVKEIHFSDDNFTLGKKHAYEVCIEILKRGLRFKWQCPNGVKFEHLDDELLTIMKKGGCHTLGFGIESGSREILNNVKKKLDLDLAYRRISSAHRIGFTTYGFFIIGLPGETHQTIKETINYTKKLPLDRAWFFIWAPIPGSSAFVDFIKDKQLDKFDWQTLDTYTGIAENEHLTKLDLQRYQRKATLAFYIRPTTLINILKKIDIRNLPTLYYWIKNRIKMVLQ